MHIPNSSSNIPALCVFSCENIRKQMYPLLRNLYDQHRKITNPKLLPFLHENLMIFPAKQILTSEYIPLFPRAFKERETIPFDYKCKHIPIFAWKPDEILNPRNLHNNKWIWVHVNFVYLLFYFPSNHFLRPKNWIPTYTSLLFCSIQFS